MKVIGWSNFQHYTKRRPPWIKLHRTILDNPAFMCLPLASKALAPLVWLLASESETPGTLPSVTDIAWRLRMRESDIVEAIKHLISNGFIEDASNTLASRKQDATLETEREGERETEGEDTHTPTQTDPPVTEGKLLDSIACPACGVVGWLKQTPARENHPPGFWCNARGGCGQNYPLDFEEILKQLTPRARNVIKALQKTASQKPKVVTGAFGARDGELERDDDRSLALEALEAFGGVSGFVSRLPECDSATMRLREIGRLLVELKIPIAHWVWIEDAVIKSNPKWAEEEEARFAVVRALGTK